VASAYLPLLRRLLDGVALLDMLAGFSAVAAYSARSYVRPTLTEAGPLALVEARHPLLECLEGDGVQPNDTYLALHSCFHVITGAGLVREALETAWHWLEGLCHQHNTAT
jgi:DNA mismatch repair ATPase MutS